MTDIPYIIKSSAIPSFLTHIKQARVPDKVTQKYLESAGFTSTNERALIKIFKALDFLDSSGIPTKRWVAYRGDSGAAVLAEAVREAYAGLFSMYPDAHRKDDEALTNWIRTHSNYSDDVVRRAVSTFKILAQQADFDANVPDEHTVRTEVPNPSPDSTPSPRATVQSPSPLPQAAPVVNVNIQLALEATDDASVYDAFFSAMKRHLFPDDE